ncbi:MAG: M48 family metallopeptidase [Myxococcota bacterium]
MTQGFGHSRRRVAFELAAFAVVLALAVWGGLAAIRTLAVRAAAALPVSVDRAVGRQAAESMLAGEERCKDDAPLRAIVDRFRPHLPAEFRDVRVYALRGAEVNAFALPGGDLFVLRGLLGEAKRTEEVAGVLGHEVGHAVLRHGMRRLARQAALSVAMALVLGGEGDVASTLAGGAARLRALKFERDDEREADDFGLDLCARAGVDPRALGEFLGKLPDAPAAWLSTHPSSAERRERLLAKARNTPVARPEATLPSIETLRAACR